jgi:hypothetical protein
VLLDTTTLPGIPSCLDYAIPQRAPVFRKQGANPDVWVLKPDGSYYTIPYDPAYAYDRCLGISDDASTVVLASSGLTAHKVRVFTNFGAAVTEITRAGDSGGGVYLPSLNLLLLQSYASNKGSVDFDVCEMDGTVIGTLTSPEAGFWSTIAIAGTMLWCSRYRVATNPDYWLFHVDLA